MEIHCDRCERVCPPLDEAIEKGWFVSVKKSVSGIPWDLVCPECLGLLPMPAGGFSEVQEVKFSEIQKYPVKLYKTLKRKSNKLKNKDGNNNIKTIS